MKKKQESVQDRAIDLRKKGYSYSYISEELLISKGTLSYWLTSIPYQPNKETIAMIGKARAASGLAKNHQKMESILRAQAEAKKDIDNINKRDLFMVGLGLYIGEGSKTNNLVRMVNSDYKVILLAMRWFNEVIGVPKENFSIRLHLYPDSNEKKTLRFWSKITGLPLGQFKKSQVDYRQDKRVSRKGKLPYGTVHMSVKSCGRKEFGVFLSRKIEAWAEEIFSDKRD